MKITGYDKFHVQLYMDFILINNHHHHHQQVSRLQIKRERDPI